MRYNRNTAVDPYGVIQREYSSGTLTHLIGRFIRECVRTNRSPAQVRPYYDLIRDRISCVRSDCTRRSTEEMRCGLEQLREDETMTSDPFFGEQLKKIIEEILDSACYEDHYLELDAYDLSSGDIRKKFDDRLRSRVALFIDMLHSMLE